MTMITRLVNMITRGKVVQAQVGQRTMLQVTGLEGEVKQVVELLLPPGYSARPVEDADVILLKANGSRDHMVALGGDNAGVDAISDLQPGEFGLRGFGMQLVFRSDSVIEINAPQIKITAPEVMVIGTVQIDGD